MILMTGATGTNGIEIVKLPSLGRVCRQGTWACGDGWPSGRDDGCRSVRIVNQKEYSCCYFSLREGLDARDGYRTVRSARSFRSSRVSRADTQPRRGACSRPCSGSGICRPDATYEDLPRDTEAPLRPR